MKQQTSELIDYDDEAPARPWQAVALFGIRLCAIVIGFACIVVWLAIRAIRS